MYLNLKVPAKALLFGEYGVLYDGKALVCLLPNMFFDIGIDVVRHAEDDGFHNTHVVVKSDFFENGLHEFVLNNSTLDACRAKEEKKGSLFFERILLPWSEHLQNCKLVITIHQSFPMDLGFGSSSAIIAAISYALFVFVNNCQPDIENEFLWKKIRGSLREIQSMASGYDVGVQLAGVIPRLDRGIQPQPSFWIYQNQKNTRVPNIKPWTLPSAPLSDDGIGIAKEWGCFVKTNVYSDTAKAVKKFSEYTEAEKSFFVDEHKKIAETFLSAPHRDSLVACMNQSVELAKKQGILADIPLVKHLEKHHIPFKTMGSGHGDCLWVASKKILRDSSIVSENDIVFDFS